MNSTKDILGDNFSFLRRNVNVEDNIEIVNNVYDDIVAAKIRDAVDKPRAIGEILSEALHKPENLKFYIKLAYLYSEITLFEALAITKDAYKQGKITTTQAQYFYGVLKNMRKK